MLDPVYMLAPTYRACTMATYRNEILGREGDVRYRDGVFAWRNDVSAFWIRWYRDHLEWKLFLEALILNFRKSWRRIQRIFSFILLCFSCFAIIRIIFFSDRNEINCKIFVIFFFDVVFKLLFKRFWSNCFSRTFFFFDKRNDNNTYREVTYRENRREKKASVSQANITLLATCGKFLSPFTSA